MVSAPVLADLIVDEQKLQNCIFSYFYYYCLDWLVETGQEQNREEFVDHKKRITKCYSFVGRHKDM